jgi:hypothetical protein
MLIRWPYGALCMLMAAAAVPRYQIPVSSWNTKPEHLTAAACGLDSADKDLARRSDLAELQKADFLLLWFLVFDFFSSTWPLQIARRLCAGLCC